MKLLFKGMTLLAAASMLVVSCVEEQMQEQETKTQLPDITAITASDDAPTRVSVTEPENGRRSIVWDKGDSISVFYRNSFLQKYVLDGEGGTTHGKFKHKSGIGLGTEFFAEVYAAYPYDRNMTINQGVLRTTFPSGQTYREDNFDAKANLMVGVAAPGETTPFKNVGGYLVLQFYGTNAKVKSVVVASNGSERLAGPVEIGVKAGQAPTVKAVEATVRPIVKSADELVSGSGEVVLTCQDSVAVGATAETATAFWFVLLPQELKDGFTVQVSYNGGLFALSQKSSVEIERSAVLRMDPVELKAPAQTDIIPFRDKNLKAHLVANGVDTDKDGEISYKEAAAVKTFDNVFERSSTSQGYPFTSFDEFGFFTGIETIKAYQFRNWKKLKSIRIPSCLTELPPCTFENCSALESIEIPGNIKTIGHSAFTCCESLSSVRINPGVELLQTSVFYGNTSLKTIVIPEGVVEVSYGCFSGCPNLQSVSLPGTLNEIVSGLFSRCTSLTEVTLAPGLKKICAGAFENSGITSIVVPGSVEEVGSDCFTRCSNLTSVVFEDGIKKINHCFGSNTSLKSVVFPGSLEYIPESICAGCHELSDLTLGSGIKVIETDAFNGCALTSVVLPASITELSGGAFNSPNLAKVTFLGTVVPTMNPGSFNSGVTISFYVPASALEDYKASGLSSYADHIFPAE